MTASTPQVGDTVALVSRLLFDDDVHREGLVVAVADDGLVSAEFPQPPHSPMTVTSKPEHFTVVRRAPRMAEFRRRHDAHRAEMPDDRRGEVYCCDGCALASELLATLEGRSRRG